MKIYAGKWFAALALIACLTPGVSLASSMTAELKHNFNQSTQFKPHWGVAICSNSFKKMKMGRHKAYRMNLSTGCDGVHFVTYVHRLLKKVHVNTTHIMINNVRKQGPNLVITFEYTDQHE